MGELQESMSYRKQLIERNTVLPGTEQFKTEIKNKINALRP